jgi:peptidyl-prolyl cis-trans isomerase D
LEVNRFMLDVLRKRKRSWVIVFLIGVIVIVFTLFYGTGPGLNQSRLEPVAEVNGEIITRQEFEVLYQRMVQFYSDLFKSNFTPETLENLNLRSAAVNELVQKHLMLQEARRLGLEATDNELREAIARTPELQVDGRFSRLRYLEVLRLNRLTPDQFEAEQRELLAIQKLSDTIQDTVHVTEAQVWDQYRLEQEKIKLDFIRLPASNFTPQVEVTEREVQEYYGQSKEALKEPLKAQVEYLAYPFSHFSPKAQASDEEVEKYYQIHRDTKFRQPQALRLRHIFFRVPEGTPSQERETVRSRAEDVLRRARSGADFAGLAKEYSQDPSAAQGGDIGFFAAGQMLPPLDKAAFALKKGEISNVVETSLGYHILKVEDVKEEKIKSLKEAREEIIRVIKSDHERSEAAKAADQDREKIISGNATLASLGEETGLPAKLSPLFSRGEVLPEVGRVEEFYKAAFSLSVKEISSVIEGSDAYYVMRIKQRKEPAIPSLESVRQKLERKLREQKTLRLATQEANALLERLRNGKDLQGLAKEHKLQVRETGWFPRGASQIPKIGSLEGLDPGGIAVSSEKPIPDRVYVQKAAVYIFAFKESQGADRAQFEKEKEHLLDQALRQEKQRVLQGLIDHLKTKAEIKVQPLFL